MKNINFEYYKVFYYVARYGSFTQAAKALYSNQPNVARVINLLEQELGCQLMIRTNRGIHLTEEGKNPQKTRTGRSLVSDGADAAISQIISGNPDEGV